MRHVTILAVFALSFISFNAFSQKKDVKQVSNTDQPYKVQSTNISIGNNAYAQKVLWAWKYYDENTTDKMADAFADDVIATFPDGSMIKGKDNLLKAVKDLRNSFASAVSEVAACVALKSPDHPENEAVSIWGMETDTAKDGTVMKTHLNEVWFFNKEGKVVELHQMAAKDAK
ncbi:MAG: nuclear transport factor 2 family protein [Flavisolibacter sp.]